MHPVVPSLGFGSEAQPLPTLEHGVAKGRGASGLWVGASQDFSAEVLPFELIRVPLDLVLVNGRARLGELLAHARVEPIDDEDVLDLSAEETAAKPEHSLALLQLVVLGWREAQRGRAVDEVVDQHPAPARPSTRLLLHGIGGQRSVVSVDQRVLVDLLGRDGAHGDDGDGLSTKTLADKILHLLGRSIWLDEHEGSPLRLAHSISRSAASLVSAATAVAAAMLTYPTNQARDAACPVP